MFLYTLRHYPLPVVVLSGLMAGLLAYLVRAPGSAEILWALTLLIGGVPVLWDTLRGMLRGHFASDIVASLAMVTAGIMQEYLAGSVVALMVTGGQALEDYGLRRAQSSLSALLSRAPRTAWRIQGRETAEIPVAEVQIGDLLVVRHGDLIPVDGILTQGLADVDMSAMTGEPLPQPVEEGDTLLAGCLVVSGSCTMQATREASQSQYAQIVALMRKAQEEKAPIERLADRAAIWFTPLTLVMAALGWWYTGDPVTILAVFVVATPCPLILAVPVAIIAGVNRAARQGIIVKGGAPMEEVGHVQAVMFDKTGTLTTGRPVVHAVAPEEGISPQELLQAAASVEQYSGHPIALALVGHLQRQNLPFCSADEVKEYPGRGIRGTVEGIEVLVGSRRFLAEQAILPIKARTTLHSEIGIEVWVARGGRLIGRLTLHDDLRPEAPELFEHLLQQGVLHLGMLTGDGEAGAAPIARQLPLTTYATGLLPAEKVHALHTLAKTYPYTIMVGDGINDAPALAAARVGVALGAHGAAISAEAASIVILDEDLRKVGRLIEIGKRTLSIAKQSAGIGMGLSLGLMVVAASGWIPPLIGALSQELIDVIVILNALRGATEGRQRTASSSPEPVGGSAPSLARQGASAR